jgi:hypothetical protein
VEWLKVLALSLNPSTRKQKTKNKERKLSRGRKSLCRDLSVELHGCVPASLLEAAT